MSDPKFGKAKIPEKSEPEFRLCDYQRQALNSAGSYDFETFTDAPVDHLKHVMTASGRLYRTGYSPPGVYYVATDPHELDKKILDALETKKQTVANVIGDDVPFLVDEEHFIRGTDQHAKENWTPHVGAGGWRGYGNFRDAKRTGSRTDGDGQSQGARSYFERQARALGDACAAGRSSRTEPRLGTQDGGMTMGALNVSVVKPANGGGSMIRLWHGDAWPQWDGGYDATAPEIDRLISMLCKARDQARAANRPGFSLKEPH